MTERQLTKFLHYKNVAMCILNLTAIEGDILPKIQQLLNHCYSLATEGCI